MKELSLLLQQVLHGRLLPLILLPFILRWWWLPHVTRRWWLPHIIGRWRAQEWVAHGFFCTVPPVGYA